MHPARCFTPRVVLPIGLLLAVLAPSPAANAAGFATARFGGEHGNPITNNATAIYYNPAGIAEAEGFHIFLDGSLAFRSATYDHGQASSDTPEPDGAIGANHGKATLFNVIGAPMVGGTAKFGSFALGAGFFVPIGGTSVWDKDDDFANNPKFPGPIDGEQRWYSIEGTIRSLYFTLAAAYEFKKIGLSVGVAANLIDSEIHTIRARNADGSDNVKSEGRSLIDVKGINWGFGVGAMFQAIPKKLWVGASYQSRPNVAGGMHMDGTLTNFFAAKDETKVSVNQDLPDIYRLGGRFRPMDTLELRLFGDFTRWSAFESQCLAPEDKPCKVNAQGAAIDEKSKPIQNLPRNWQDTVGVRGGASYWFVPKVEGFFGLGFDSNAIPDESLDPALTDFNKISVGGGARVELIKQLHAAASWTEIFYLSRDTNGKSKNAGYVTPSNGPDAGGKYTQLVGVLNVNLEASF